MKHTRLHWILFILTLMGSFLLYSAYYEVRIKTIDQLHSQQLTLAKAAARGIEGFFDHYTRLLDALSKLDSIAAADEDGKKLMEVFYQAHAGEILSLTRIDTNGRVMHTVPPNPTVAGADFSGLDHFKKVTRTHLPTVSDVFMSARGVESIALSIPVLGHDVFQGSITVLIPFNDLAGTYLEGIKVSEDGYSWMIDSKGVELYCTVPAHIGKTVFENCGNVPSILSITGEMLQGKEGQATYVSDEVHGISTGPVRKYAAYVPVHLPDNFWSVAVATPEGEISGIIHGFRGRCLLIAGFMFVSVALYLCRTLIIAREGSKRKRIELALQESERKYRQLVELAQEGIWVIDTGGDTTFVNPRMAEILGYTTQEMLGRPLHSFMAGQSVDICIPLLELCKQGVIEEYDFIFVRKDGVSIHAHMAVCPIIDNGNYTGALAVVVDITKRKRAEEALMESQQRLSDIIDFLPDATFVIDREGKVIAWNRAMEEMTGTGAAAILGRGGHEYALPLYGERRPILIDLVLDPSDEVEGKYLTLERKGGALAARAYIRDLRGCEAYLSGTASALYDSKGNVMGAIESIRDTTERMLMEEAIAKAEEKYRNIFENSVTGIFQVTVDGRLLQINTAIARIHGFDSPDELLRKVKDIRELYVHPELRSEMLRLIEEQGSVRDFEVDLIRKDKSVVWVALNVRSVRNSTGEIAYMEGTATDISDRKLLRARLDQAQKMEAIGTLAGGIAHDFNNILTPIIGYTELSLNTVPEDSRLSHNMRQVLLSANRAKDLVRQILTFSRKTEQEQKPVQLSLIVKEVLKLLRSSLPSTIDIRQSLHPDAIDATTMADPTHIHQVLMNLCTNAAHAMRGKGGTLTIALENVEIGPRARRGTPDMEPGPYLRLSVADTGHGMDETVRHRIFDPYFTTKGPNEGTGLGLAVVYGIVKNLSGAIAVSSEPGKGSTFDIYFPRTKTIPAPPAELSELLPTGHGLILLVDDEKFIVDMVREMLETLGYETVPRYSSTDALEAFRARPESFDLVITDMTMPHMTGIDLAKEILMIRPHTPVILCTGFSETVDEDKAKLLGIKKLLMKPVSMRDLAVTVNKILAGDRQDTTTR